MSSSTSRSPLTLAQARALAALAARQRRLLSVFHNRRWDSDLPGRAPRDRRRHQSARWCISNRISTASVPKCARAGANAPVPAVALWFDLGPHLIDQALQLFGLPERINGGLRDPARAAAKSDDWAHVLLDYGAKRAILHGSMLVAGGSARFTVHGTRGSVVKPRIDQQEAQLLRGLRPGDAGWGEDDDPLLHTTAASAPPRRIAATAGDQCRYYTAIRDALDGRGDNPVTPLQAVAVMAVLETAVEAARDGCARSIAATVEERAAWSTASRNKVDAKSLIHHPNGFTRELR